MRTHYDVLGVSPRADLDTIKRAFRLAAKAHHPDLTGGGDADADHKLKMIIIAYKVLRDADLRAEYDAHLVARRTRIRRERWDAVLQFTAATSVLSAILIGLEILLLPSANEWLNKSPTRSIASRPPQQSRSLPQREARSEPPPAPKGQEKAQDKSQDARSGMLQVSRPSAEGDQALSASPEAPAGAGSTTSVTTSSAMDRAIERSRQGDLDGAIAGFDEAIRLAPRNAEAYHYRARTWGRKGLWDRALADYDRAIRLDPDDPALYHDRGLALQQKGEFDEALVDLDRAIRMNFSDAELYSDRGAVWLAKGRYDRALADFNQALKLNPGLASATDRRDEALARKREQDPAADNSTKSRSPAVETTGALPADPVPKSSPR